MKTMTFWMVTASNKKTGDLISHTRVVGEQTPSLLRAKLALGGTGTPADMHDTAIAACIVEVHGPFVADETTRVDDLAPYIVCWFEKGTDYAPKTVSQYWIDARNDDHAIELTKEYGAAQMGCQPDDESWEQDLEEIEIVSVVRLRGSWRYAKEMYRALKNIIDLTVAMRGPGVKYEDSAVQNDILFAIDAAAPVIENVERGL